MCVKGEESVGRPGAQAGKSVADQQSSFMGFWGKVGGRAKRCPVPPYSAYSGIWERGGLRLPGTALPAGLGGEGVHVE